VIRTLARSLLLLVTAAALTGAAPAQSSESAPTTEVHSAKKLPPILGISYRSPRGVLAWFDPLTLRMLPGRKAPMGGFLGSWAFSGDRAVLASASCGADSGPEAPGIRFVNARVMRVLGELQLASTAGCAGSLTWLRADRLLVVVNTEEGSEVLVVNPGERRVVRREPLPSGTAAVLSRTRDELVLLLTNEGEIAAARLAVVDAEGVVREVTVARVLEGSVVEDPSTEHSQRVVSPGFAVDPEGRRAFLVPASGGIAEVDLRTLAVSYHALERPSLVQRFLRWLTPAAEAKSVVGPYRHALWLGGGMIAVSGMDNSMVADAEGQLASVGTPVGLSLVDTRSWSARVLNSEASDFAVAPGIVIAQGGRWDPQAQRSIGPGLLAFGLDGRMWWRLHAGEYRWIDPAGAVGYVWMGEGKLEVADLEAGVVLRTIRRDERRNPWPQLLASQAAGW